MPSVRDILKGPQPDQDPVEQKQVLGPLASKGGAVSRDTRQERSAAELIAERLRFATDQRAALAQSEIRRLQQRIDQLQETTENHARQNLPIGDLRADLDDARLRMDEAKADLSRAREARENTDLTASLSQSRHEGHAHEEHHGTRAAASVRSALDHPVDSGPTKLPSGPARRH